MTLIVLSAVALALGVLTAFVVFFPSGSYRPVVLQGPGAVSFSNFPSATTTNTLSGATTTASAAPGAFASEYASPYPVTWTEGRETFSVTGAAFQDNNLTLTIGIKMSDASECVPMNLRLIADEFGTERPPAAPTSTTFTFPDTRNCAGTPGAIYSLPVTFAIDASVTTPYLVTTGGMSNVLFNLATSTSGGVDIALPSTSG